MSAAIDHTGPWTVADVLALPDGGTHARHELIDGTLIVSPAPGYPHQRASRRLATLLEEAAQATGVAVEVFEAVNVETSSGLVIPDIAVVRADVARRAELTLPAAAMVAVMEIVSPSTRRIDRLVKPGVYAEAGIPSYWRLELERFATLSVFSLRAGEYAETAIVSAGEPVTIPVPYPVTVDLEHLLTI
jgi:Uma2 family endonuclease